MPLWVGCRAVGRGGAGGAWAPPIILTGPLWNNCTIVCELAMPPENTNSQYNTITNCYKTTSWASTHAGPANWNLHLGSRFCANMFQKCRKLLLRELQFSKFSWTPLETKLLNILYMYNLLLFSNWAGPPQKILSCHGPGVCRVWFLSCFMRYSNNLAIQSEIGNFFTITGIIFLLQVGECFD